VCLLQQIPARAEIDAVEMMAVLDEDGELGQRVLGCAREASASW